MTDRRAPTRQPRSTPATNHRRVTTASLAVDPAFPEAEQATLGALMLSPSAADRLVPVLRESHFYYWQNAQVYAAIRDLHQQGRPVDPITVHAQLRETGRARLGERDAGVYLATCLEATYFPGRAADYAATVLDTAARRRLLQAGMRITQRANNPAGDTTELVDDALEQIADVQAILQQRDVLLRPAPERSDGIGL
jgi:replicative DNA helicase